MERRGEMKRRPILDGVAREGLPQEMTFKLRTE